MLECFGRSLRLATLRIFPRYAAKDRRLGLGVGRSENCEKLFPCRAARIGVGIDHEIAIGWVELSMRALAQIAQVALGDPDVVVRNPMHVAAGEATDPVSIHKMAS